MQHDHVLKKLDFYLLVGGDMQHDHVLLKKLDGDLLTPSQGKSGERSAGNHVDVFVIFFNLICNMTMS